MSLSMGEAIASGNKRISPKTPHQATGRLQPQLVKQKVDLFRPYPSEWNDLSENKFFFKLQDEERPAPPFVVDWCNGMLSLFEESSCQKDINEITLASLITLLGQKAKKDKKIRAVLQDYFQKKPELMSNWTKNTIHSLQGNQFNQQNLANIFCGHAQLGMEPEGEFFIAWKKVALPYLQSTNSQERFTLKEIHSIYLTIKRFSLGSILGDNFPQASLIKKGKTKTPKGSKLQEEVLQSVNSYLARIGISNLAQEEYWVDDIASHVDIYLASLNVIMEVDGPSHFFAGTQEYKPKNKLKEEILHQSQKFAGLVRIPYYEWNKMITLESQHTYLAGKLSPFIEAAKQRHSLKTKKEDINAEERDVKKSTLRPEVAPYIPLAERKNQLLPTKQLSNARFEDI